MAKPETITSAANPLLKDVRRAIARGALTEQGWCVAETFHLLEEALRSDCDVKVVLAAESVLPAALEHVGRHIGEARVKVAVLPDALFQSLSGMETGQGVMALVKPPVWKPEQLFRGCPLVGCPLAGCPLVVVLDGLQDPGNAGAIVRAAEAFGATGVFFLKGTASPFNSKTLRASAGSLFRIPYLHGVDAAQALTALQQNRVALYAGVPRRAGAPARPLSDIDLTPSCALIIGNEAHGVSRDLRSAAVDIAIPTAGVESLNAAVAAGILLYEARRQRALKP